MNLRRVLRKEDGGGTSALNDILFILLFFFLIISTLANPNVVKVNNPKAKSDTKVKQTLVVTVDTLHNYYVGTTLTSRDSLNDVVKREIDKRTDTTIAPTVVINADAKLAQPFTDIIQAASAAGAKTVLAVQKP